MNWAISELFALAALPSLSSRLAFWVYTHTMLWMRLNTVFCLFYLNCLISFAFISLELCLRCTVHPKCCCIYALCMYMHNMCVTVLYGRWQMYTKHIKWCYQLIFIENHLNRMPLYVSEHTEHEHDTHTYTLDRINLNDVSAPPVERNLICSNLYT